MNRILSTLAFIAALFGASLALAQTDSTGASSKGLQNYVDVTASSTWNRVANKPATATHAGQRGTR